MILFAFVCLTGSMLQSLCGFGSAVFAMSVLPHFFHSYSFSLVLSTISSLVICFFIAIKERKHINVRTILPIIIGNALAITLVMIFWSGHTDSIMKKALGGFFVFLSLYFIFFKKNVIINPTFITGFTFGILGGTANALFSVGGPPVALYLITSSKNTKEYIASLQAYFCFSSAYVTITRFFRGMITTDIWPFILVGLPFIALGSFAGLKLSGVFNEEKLRLFIYIFMAVSGTVMIFS